MVKQGMVMESVNIDIQILKVKAAIVRWQSN